MAINRSRFQNIRIPLSDLTDILKGRCGVIKGILPDDAVIMNVDGYLAHDAAILSVFSKEYPEKWTTLPELTGVVI